MENLLSQAVLRKNLCFRREYAIIRPKDRKSFKKALKRFIAFVFFICLIVLYVRKAYISPVWRGVCLFIFYEKDILNDIKKKKSLRLDPASRRGSGSGFCRAVYRVFQYDAPRLPGCPDEKGESCTGSHHLEHPNPAYSRGSYRRRGLVRRGACDAEQPE